MNKDEALKCYQFALQAIEENDFDKAERFLTKSIRLHETTDA